VETNLLCPSDERYPVGLRWIHDPPRALYVRGTLVEEDRPALAIVGSRKASAYGRAVAERIAGELARDGVTVVSGLAVGIDEAAHRGALRAGGRTIAVLGSGIDRIYPPQNRRLADEIAERGAVVSELPPGTPPLAHHFPRRNRLVSGLSLGVVVVEANEKSGSLITARLALEQGREVCAVPGEVGLDRTKGVHALIRRGAKLVETGADVIEEVMSWRAPPHPNPLPLRGRGDTCAVLAAFESTIEHVDRLIERSGLESARVLERLLALELDGRVVRHAGMLFEKRSG